MSVGETGQLAMTCRRGHKVVHTEPVECDGGHRHLRFVCLMRVGSSQCGWSYVLPPFSDSCQDGD